MFFKSLTFPAGVGAVVLLGATCSMLCAPRSSEPPPPQPPRVEREFRGVWIATVGNINWPSKRGLTSEEQQREMIAILDRARSLNLNAVIFQVRPACDAVYASALEPWSEYLTGEMGKPPEPYYDPLAFAISEAHRRGLELHAWFNPYRVRHPSATGPASRNHISRARPDLVRRYGRHFWLDPGERAVQIHSRNVILDVLTRYDVDGIHIDDYFYPYREKDGSGRVIDFPDDAAWQRYVGSGGRLSRADWRRENVNTFVRETYEAIKARKPWVKFGVSPFGIWRPGHPEQITGMDPYNEIYADSKKWLNEGWLDYFAPQLYWAVDPPRQSFPVLLKWWAAENHKHRHLWPGLYTSRVSDGQWKADEILRQIGLTRRQIGVTGQIHFSVAPFMRDDDGLATELARGLYAAPALVPASAWLSSARPERPRVEVRGERDQLRLEWSSPGTNRVANWVVQTGVGNRWRTQILSGAQTGGVFPSGRPDVVAVTAVDRYGNLSETVLVDAFD